MGVQDFQRRRPLKGGDRERKRERRFSKGINDGGQQTTSRSKTTLVDR
jgi:hypothetical protein